VKNSKTMVFILAMILIVSLVVGCGGSGAKNDSKAQPAKSDVAWPQKTVTIIVPYSAGGGADLMARALATPLEKELGKAFVVTNKPGGSGAIGMSELARAKADGHTFILTSVGACTLTPNNSNVGYTNKEFAPVAQLADIPLLIAVHKDSPIKTLKELFAAAEKNPGKMTYGTAGAGLIQNVSMEGLLLGMNKRGLFAHVPFNGGAEAVTALLGKQTDFAVAIATEIIPQLKSGEFRALAVSSAGRYALTPDVPTFKELGYDLQVGVWYGFAAPKGTPEAVIKKFQDTILKATKDPAVMATFKKINQPIIFLDSKAFTEKWMKDFETNKKVIAALKAKK
jgi:tripartite-type tricarboxylate transporter receptor subunit TctC